MGVGVKAGRHSDQRRLASNILQQTTFSAASTPSAALRCNAAQALALQQLDTAVHTGATSPPPPHQRRIVGGSVLGLGAVFQKMLQLEAHSIAVVITAHLRACRGGGVAVGVCRQASSEQQLNCWRNVEQLGLELGGARAHTAATGAASLALASKVLTH